MNIDDSIKFAIKDSGHSLYRIGLSTSIAWKSLKAFMDGKSGLGRESLNRLAVYLKLSLQPIASPSVQRQ